MNMIVMLLVKSKKQGEGAGEGGREFRMAIYDLYNVITISGDRDRFRHRRHCLRRMRRRSKDSVKEVYKDKEV